MSDPPFKKGDKIEISIDEQGFRGAWFAGTVIKAPKKREKKVLVEYDTLLSDKDETKPLREPVDIVKIRPVPPREADRPFKVNEEVDAYHDDGWWEGIVMSVVEEGSKYSVYFRPSGEQLEFAKSDLRLHREWIHGDWVPPFPEPQELSTSGLNHLNETQEEIFNEGSLVEVRSDEEGFKGAWFAATVVQVLGKGKYLIQYLDLRTDDDTEFAKEEVDAINIRPTPPKTEVIDRFSLHEEIDALYNDGWWVGVISKVLANSMYKVYFMDSKDEMKFSHNQLRQHHEWIDGKWITSSKVLH